MRWCWGEGEEVEPALRSIGVVPIRGKVLATSSPVNPFVRLICSS